MRIKRLHCCAFFFALLFSSLTYAESSEGKISVPGGHIWYRIHGNLTESTVPILVIHGGPGGSSCGLQPLTELSRLRPVIFYDQLGAGKSDHPNDVALWQVDRFVEELNQLIQSLHLHKVHLLAHSWGAAIAGQYLLTHGTDAIASVIFVGPFLSSRDWVESTKTLARQLPLKTQDVINRHLQQEKFNTPEYLAAEEAFYHKFLFRNPANNNTHCDDDSWNPSIYHHMWGESEFAVSGNLKNFDAAKNLDRIAAPTLFIVGEFDEVREATVKKYQRNMANAKVAIVKDAAHMSMLDQPQLFIRTVNEFIDGLAPTKRTPK